jgi:hypothetical protein
VQICNTRKALDIIVDGWVAMKPVLGALTMPAPITSR